MPPMALPRAPCSGGPGEVRVRHAGLALVLDAEGADLRALRLRHGEVGRDRVEHAVELHGVAVLDAERDDVLDLEVDRVVDAHAVAHAVVVDLDRGALDAEHLADQRRETRHRPPELPREDLDELVRLLLARVGVDERTELPVPVGHHLRRVCDRHELQTANVGPLDLALLDVEAEGDAAVVIRRSVVEAEVARAHQVARARLHVTTADIPRHGGSPWVGWNRAILSGRWIESQLVGSQRDGCSDARAARLEAARLLALRRRPRAGPPERMGAVVGNAGRAVPLAPAIAAARLHRPRLLRLRPGGTRPRGARGRRGPAASRRDERARLDAVQAVRTRSLHSAGRATGPGARLAGGLR